MINNLKPERKNCVQNLETEVNTLFSSSTAGPLLIMQIEFGETGGYM